jgi:hypothetical protein
MINVTVVSRDLHDIFLTVFDLNQAVGPVVLNAARLNKGQSRVVAVQEDGSALGHVSWQVNVASDPSTITTGEVDKLNDGDTVTVSS